MQIEENELRQTINRAFINQLEIFKSKGYQFQGTERQLFEGTQREAFDAYLQGIKSNTLEGYFEIPTGVGKTALFIAIISCYLKATEGIPNAPRVLIHEPTNDLVDQTVLAFADFLPDIAKVIEGNDYQGRTLDVVNSQIHYKAKGAKSDARIVVTTYQGQAADDRKASNAPDKQTALANLTYKPEEFHLVIHDEAHYLTGPKYGPAAVDKFKGALQIGLTATPEYSADKKVANKLEHRYYHLPLEEAMRRGDLCQARPILIKTKFSEQDRQRLKMAKIFLKKQEGKPLSSKQLEQLYNQESRNIAAVKAYLLGEHPDTGQRYLGQTGMIFAGGIAHCDDFVRQAHEALNQPDYHGIKNWLRDNDLCLIAPIHSAIPKDGIDITMGGKKRRCTKNEIKELHRKGKVLLLISDQELKLGTDFPMDSFCVELVDRFSVPDAGQRIGRLLRVDRGNKRLGLFANPDKNAALLNIIDENTHDIYAGTSHHPIHAAEVLGGAQHRPSVRRIGAITRFTPVPEVGEALKELGFTFETDMQAIREVVKRFKSDSKSKLPDKDDAWFSSVDTRDPEKVPGGNRPPIQAVVKALIGEMSAYNHEEFGIQVLKHNDQFIRVQKMQSMARQALCICAEDWPKVESAAEVKAGVVLPDKDDNWWAAEDIKNSKKVPGGTRVSVRAVVKALTGKSSRYNHDELGIQLLEHNGQHIRVQKMQSANHQVLCINKDDWPKVELAADVGIAVNLPIKDDAWLSSRDTQNAKKMPGAQRESVQAVVLALTGAACSYDHGLLGIQSIEYKGQQIRVQKMQCGSKQSLCICREDWPKVESIAGVKPWVALPIKNEKWLSSNDTRDPLKVPGGKRESLQVIVRALTGESSPYDQETLGIQLIEFQGESLNLQKMQSGTKSAICICRDDWPKVERIALRKPLIISTDIKPGSNDLVRTGRVRSYEE